MAPISFGGLASGLDTNAIIDGIMGAERIPLNQLRNRQAKLNSAKETISGIASKLSTLKAAALALSTPEGFSSLKASSSSSSVVATVTGPANPGAFKVTVSSIAREQRNHSATFASATDDLNMTGQLGIAVGTGAPKTVNVEAGDSLTDIAAKINGSGSRVSAAVLFDGTNYRIALRALDTGNSNVVSFTETALTLGLTSPASVVQVASDAVMEVDGITIRRPTNQVAGVIPGVTLALTKESATPVDVNVDANPDDLHSKVQAFVTAYNDVVQSGHAAAGFGALRPANTELAGDQTIRSALDRLTRIIGSPPQGATGKFSSLASVGLGTDRDGKIVFNQDKFKAAMVSDAASVRAIFVSDPSQGTTGVMSGVTATTDSLSGGSSSLLKARIDSLGRMSSRLDDDAAAQERRLALYEQQLRDRFTRLEATISKYKSQGDAITSALFNLGGNR